MYSSNILSLKGLSKTTFHSEGQIIYKVAPAPFQGRKLGSKPSPLLKYQISPFLAPQWIPLLVCGSYRRKWIRKLIFLYPCSQDHPKRLASFPCTQNICPGSPISYSRLVVKVSVGKVPCIHQKFQPINKGGIVWKNLFFYLTITVL